MKTFLLSSLIIFSLSGFAQEVCKEGFFCEKTESGVSILRAVTLVHDESLDVCQVVTIANFGLDEAACKISEEELNKKTINL
jgi:hypothetical protein